MFCPRCGTAVADEAAFCGKCGQPMRSAQAPVAPGTLAPAAAGAVAPPAYAVQAFTPPSPYAGFWLRLVAYLIDGFILGVSVGALVLIAAMLLGISLFHGFNLDSNVNPGDNVVASTLGVMFILACLGFVILSTWLYYAWFESSERQATLGKMALGLYVTDMEGRRLSFGRASGRFFAKIVTGVIPFFIGYIMAGFTAKKQALHDMIAGCLVLRKN